MPLTCLGGTLTMTSEKGFAPLPREVIIVEGRDDTKRLIEVFGPQVKTIETNGSALSRSVMSDIEHAADQYGVIVFTDPDYQGDRVRRLISDRLPQAKHAYLQAEEARGRHKHDSLGVEHASPEAIIQALDHLMTPVDEALTQSLIPLADLIALKLVGHSQSKLIRNKVAKHFHLGHTNAKQLQKRLARYQVSYTALKDYLSEMEDTDDFF